MFSAIFIVIYVNHIFYWLLQMNVNVFYNQKLQFFAIYTAVFYAV